MDLPIDRQLGEELKRLKPTEHHLDPLEQLEESKIWKATPFSDLDEDHLMAIFGDSLRFVLCQLILVKDRIYHPNSLKFFGTIQAAAGGFSLDPRLQHNNRSIFNREFNNPIHISSWPIQILHDDICYCSLPVSSTSVVQIAANLYITTDKLDAVEAYPPDDEPVPLKLEPPSMDEVDEADEMYEIFRALDILPTLTPCSTGRQIAEPTIPIPNKEPFIDYNKAFHVCRDHTSINISDKPKGGAGCSRLHGKDGTLYLRYVVFKYAIDAELEVEFDTDEHTQVTGSVKAYYGKGFLYDDKDNPACDYHVWLLHPPDPKHGSADPPAAYVKPGRVSLYRSVLPVPANSSLIIEAELDQGEDVILSGTLEFPVPRDYHSSSKTIQGDDCSLKLKVNWKLPPSEEPKIRSSSNSSSVTCHLTERRRKFGANSTSTMADPDKCNRWSLQEEIAKVFNTSLKRTFKLQEDVVPCTISTCTKEDDGDYMCSAVLDIWPKIANTRLYKGPKLAGLAVKDNIMRSDYKDMMERCVVCGPGFVKFKLSREWIPECIDRMVKAGIQTWAPKLPVSKASIYLFPRNIAAEGGDMEYEISTYFGETLTRMLEYSGVVVHRIGFCGSDSANINELREARQCMNSVSETIQGTYKTLYHKLLGIDVKKEDESFYESYTREILLELVEDLHIGIGKDVLLAHLLLLGHTLKEENAGWIVHVSGVGKLVYIEMCITAAERAGLIANDHSECPLSHLGIGLVEVPEELGSNVAAKVLGVRDFKYEFLKNNRLTSYTPSVEMLYDERNTAVYLRITYARIRSIIRECNVVHWMYHKMPGVSVVPILKHDDERELGLYLLRFTEVVEEVCTNLAPHILCDYLYGLCNKFNSLAESMMEERWANKGQLVLCVATEKVMSQCFLFFR